ncbi:MAG: CheR family methyltransferase [Halothece sp.]
MTLSNPESNPEFEALLQYLKQVRGCDFTGYKRSTLQRRINKRMEEVNIPNYNAYQDYLEVHPEEFIVLFNTILINVTSFFRDMQAWERLSHIVIPRILEQTEPNEAIRIWTAGCSSGQEALTIAILFAEQMGLQAFREQVKIYATDIDEEALGEARIACYAPKQMENLPSELLEKYFDLTEEGEYSFTKNLRRSIIFGRHNLVSDAPISRLNLLTCRNTLMYFNAETQAKILARFHFGLKNNGFLFLGKSETLLTNNVHFTPINLKQRIFMKVQNPNLRDHWWLLSQAENRELPEHYSSMSNYVRLREAAFDASGIAQIILDLNGIVVLINQEAQKLFNLANRDVGHPFKD